MTASLLDFVLDGPARERLTVTADGAVRYLILTAAHPDWADRVGLFTRQLGAEELDRVRGIAAALVAAAPTPRGRSGPVVTATTGGREVTHGLTSDDPAAALLSELIEQTRVHPYAVLSLTPELVGTSLRLVLRSVGDHPVTVQLAGPSIGVATREGDGWTSAWHSDVDTWLFLVDARSQDLDGVDSPATLHPGTEARLHLGAIFTDPPESVSVSLDGWLDATEPVESGADDEDPFAGTRPGRWAIHLSAITR